MYECKKLDELISYGLPVKMVAFLIPIDYEPEQTLSGESDLIIKGKGKNIREFIKTKYGPIKAIRHKTVKEITTIDLVQEIVLDDEFNVVQYN